MTSPERATEPRDIAQKRLAMRSMRRGIKEMDLILRDFADRSLSGMTPETLAQYDGLLDENDHDIYGWICGIIAPPPAYAALIAQIAAGAQGLVRP